MALIVVFNCVLFEIWVCLVTLATTPSSDITQWYHGPENQNQNKDLSIGKIGIKINVQINKCFYQREKST